MGQPVTGRPVVQRLLRHVACVDLGQRSCFDGGSDRDQLLDLLHDPDQLVVRPRGPQRLGQRSQGSDGLRDHPRRGGAGRDLGDRHRDIESGTTDIQSDIHRAYPRIRDNPQKEFRKGKMKKRTGTTRSTSNNAAGERRRPEVPQPQARATTLLALNHRTSTTTARCIRVSTSSTDVGRGSRRARPTRTVVSTSSTDVGLVSTSSTDADRGLDQLDRRRVSSRRPSPRPSASGSRPRGSRRCRRRRPPAGCRPRSRCAGP